MLATVEVLTSNHPPSQGGTTGAVVLPADAVQLVRGIPTVFLAAPDGKGGAQFTGRRVDTGARMGNRVMVLRGIRLGERVVIQGAFAVECLGRDEPRLVQKSRPISFRSDEHA